MIMIQANELRIGNSVYRIHAPYGTEHSRWIEQIKKGSDIDNQTLPSSYTIPIPLTADILERCGFEGRDFIELSQYEFLCVEPAGVVFQTETGEREVHRFKMPHIKYLHQLQNLFYALVGKELEFKH